MKNLFYLSDTSEEEAYDLDKLVVSMSFLENICINKIYNLSVTSTTFPNGGRVPKFKRIFKKGKKNPDSSNYQLISLLQSVLSTFESDNHNQKKCISLRKQFTL